MDERVLEVLNGIVTRIERLEGLQRKERHLPKGDLSEAAAMGMANQAMCEARPPARAMIEQRIHHLRRKADSLESLLKHLPEALSRPAAEALAELMDRKPC